MVTEIMCRAAITSGSRHSSNNTTFVYGATLAQLKKATRATGEELNEK